MGSTVAEAHNSPSARTSYVLGFTLHPRRRAVVDKPWAIVGLGEMVMRADLDRAIAAVLRQRASIFTGMSSPDRKNWKRPASISRTTAYGRSTLVFGIVPR